VSAAATLPSDAPIRVVLGILGLDQHEAGALAVAQILRDHGLEVIYTGRFQQPDGLAAVATTEDADVIAISCHSWEFLYYAQELVEILDRTLPRIPVVIGGSVVTPEDRKRVLEVGVDAAVLKDGGADTIVATVRDLAAKYRAQLHRSDCDALVTITALSRGARQMSVTSRILASIGISRAMVADSTNSL
jgi:methylmalonyl-CoA mutase, C-terminal domain